MNNARGSHRCLSVQVYISQMSRCAHAGVSSRPYFTVRPTHVGGLSDEPLLRVEDVFDATDQLQRTAVIRALKEKEHMCCVKAR